MHHRACMCRSSQALAPAVLHARRWHRLAFLQQTGQAETTSFVVALSMAATQFHQLFPAYSAWAAGAGIQDPEALRPPQPAAASDQQRSAASSSSNQDKQGHSAAEHGLLQDTGSLLVEDARCVQSSSSDHSVTPSEPNTGSQPQSSAWRQQWRRRGAARDMTGLREHVSRASSSSLLPPIAAADVPSAAAVPASSGRARGYMRARTSDQFTSAAAKLPGSAAGSSTGGNATVAGGSVAGGAGLSPTQAVAPKQQAPKQQPVAAKQPDSSQAAAPAQTQLRPGGTQHGSRSGTSPGSGQTKRQEQPSGAESAAGGSMQRVQSKQQ